MRNSVLPILTTLSFLLSTVSLTHAQKARLLTSYLPASMQALAYYIDQLQYEPLSTVTVEPPFNANGILTLNISTIAGYSTTKRPTLVWSAPSWWQHTTTKKTTHMPSTTTTRTTSTTSTKRPNNAWTAPSWWQQSTRKPITTTTLRPNTTIVWWKPPVWWQNPTRRTTQITGSTTETPSPTPYHIPGIYAPLHIDKNEKKKKHLLEGYEIFCQFEASDTETLAELPSALIRDIRTETDHDQFTNDVESLDDFLRLYDDNYGRDTFSNVDAILDRWSSTSTAGKKRVPPNKPYVEFLLVYDLLKRDAKAENLSKYEGYSEEMLQQLNDLSVVSAPRQLYMLFKRMLERRDIQRSDVVSRIQMLAKELGNSQSETSKALQPIPALKFLL